MAKKKRRGLIRGNLERISSKVFDLYHNEITELVRKHHGVYALYKKDRLYYVGLANNLKSRVKHHLRDRHAMKWDTFSLYLIRNVAYLHELESLLVHIAEPTGNIIRGSFTRSVNLLGTLEEMMEERDKHQREDILSDARGKHHRKHKTLKRKRLTGPHQAPKGLVLHKLLSPGAKIKAIYKGKEILAAIDDQGKILLNGKLFNSPSAAGVAVIDRSTVNGWQFWKYQNSEGKWVALAELLEKKL